MRSRSIHLFLFIVLFAVGSASGQNGEQSGMVKTAKGVLVVWNEPGNYYTLEIRSEDIVPASQPLLFKVDGKFFQIQTVLKTAFLKDPNDKGLDDKAILSAHRDWEGNYISGVIGNTLKIDSEWLKLPNIVVALAWSYDMPKKVVIDQSAKRQLYLAVIKRNHVLLLNGATTGSDDEKALKHLLLDVMATLKSNDKPLSLKKAQEQVSKGN